MTDICLTAPAIGRTRIGELVLIIGTDETADPWCYSGLVYLAQGGVERHSWTIDGYVKNTDAQTPDDIVFVIPLADAVESSEWDKSVYGDW